MILIPTDKGELIFIEAPDGRRLLFDNGEVCCAQQAPQEEGDVVSASPWDIGEGYEHLSTVLHSVHDEPQLQVLPQGPKSILFIHSIQLVDLNASEDGNQLAGILLDYGPAFWLTITSHEGLGAILLYQDSFVDAFKIEGGRVVGSLRPPEYSNLTYVRSAIRNWLKNSLGEEWDYFK